MFPAVPGPRDGRTGALRGAQPGGGRGPGGDRRKDRLEMSALLVLSTELSKTPGRQAKGFPSEDIKE